MNSERSIAEQILLVERRLDLRRERATRHLREAGADIARTRSWLPAVGAAGALIMGFVLARRRPSMAGPTTQATRLGVFATLLGLAGTVTRIALSPAARALWTSWRASRSTVRPTARA